MQTSASDLIKRLRIVMITAVVLGVLVTALGWPRTITCDDTSACDGTSGSWGIVAAGIGVLAVGFCVLVVWAAAVGTRLGLRAEREAAGQVDVTASVDA